MYVGDLRFDSRTCFLEPILRLCWHRKHHTARVNKYESSCWVFFLNSLSMCCWVRPPWTKLTHVWFLPLFLHAFSNPVLSTHYVPCTRQWYPKTTFQEVRLWRGLQACGVWMGREEESRVNITWSVGTGRPPGRRDFLVETWRKWQRMGQE